MIPSCPEETFGSLGSQGVKDPLIALKIYCISLLAVPTLVVDIWWGFILLLKTPLPPKAASGFLRAKARELWGALESIMRG